VALLDLDEAAADEAAAETGTFHCLQLAVPDMRRARGHRGRHRFPVLR
jgi:hypothetical protein